jgi:hypothetical protein
MRPRLSMSVYFYLFVVYFTTIFSNSDKTASNERVTSE